MTSEHIKKLLAEGEGLTVEFKECVDGLNNSVWETVCSFSNRYGGHLLLGVGDDGEVIGVNPKAAGRMKKNFVNMLNNPQRFSPTLFIALDEILYDGRLMLWAYIPPSSQVAMFADRIYDRAEDGDVNVTKNSALVAQIHAHKSHEFSERKIFPFADEGDLEMGRLMPKVRKLVRSRREDHPWLELSDMEIMQSAGLCQKDRETGKSGFNLAAILLFGREDVIRSCTPNYLTDAIYRVDNTDRYDDRRMVSVNLIDAYDQLMDFVNNHTLDRFFLIDGQSVSVRSKIARELVSNILVHREYTSAYPAKIIIERDRIVTENWSIPKNPGRIDPTEFTPYPKNPLLANFFVQIGWADTLGSGVRNLYKYTKIYSGEEPELIDGDVFKTVVPLGLSPTGMSDNGNLSDNPSDNGNMSDNLSDNGNMSDNLSDNLSDNGNMRDNLSDNGAMGGMPHKEILIAYVEKRGEISAQTAAALLERSPGTARRILSELAADGIVDAVGANRNRVYRLAKG